MDAGGANEFSQLMTRAGLGIDEAAGLLGVNARTVRRYINGEARRVDRLKIEKLREIANARCPVGPAGRFHLHRPVCRDRGTTPPVRGNRRALCVHLRVGSILQGDLHRQFPGTGRQ